MLDVDFEWFDPNPEIDFYGLKNLLRQLFDVDNELFDLSALTDMILAQPLLGSTVKASEDDNVPTKEGDPYAFLSVLNLHEHRDKPLVQALTRYLISRSQSIPALAPLASLLDPSSTSQVGLILTERFINMPTEIVPPMYTMLLEELQWALEEKEPYKFSHYLVLSKTYTEVASKLDAEETRPNKKKKAQDTEAETFFFHPEDEAMQKFATGWGNFEYEKQGAEGASDAKRTFQELGIKPQGHLMLIEGARFAEAVKGLTEYLGGTPA